MNKFKLKVFKPKHVLSKHKRVKLKEWENSIKIETHDNKEIDKIKLST